MRECTHQLTDTGEENIMEDSEIDAIGRELLRQAMQRAENRRALTQGPFNAAQVDVVPSPFMAEKIAEQAELRKVKKDLEDILGHLRKLVYENGSRKIDMRTEVINILAEYE